MNYFIVVPSGWHPMSLNQDMEKFKVKTEL